MALKFKIPTFEELLKRVKAPKVTIKTAGDLVDSDSASRLGYKIPPEWKLGQDITGTSLVSPRGNIFRNLKLSPEGKIEDFEPFSAEGKPIRLPSLLRTAEPSFKVEVPTGTPPPPPIEPPPVEPPPPIKVSEQEARAIYEQRQREIDIKYRKPGQWEFKDPSEEARQAFLAEKQQAWDIYQGITPSQREAMAFWR